MSVRITQLNARERRHARVRAKISGTTSRPRLSVFRSAKHIDLQLIDDTSGRTLVSISDRTLKIEKPSVDSVIGRKIALAYQMGEQLAKLAVVKGVTKIVFDRGGYAYHGRVKSVADGARAGGLIF